MPMNTVIQEKRKELGLTQEQVAEYLNVSTPAVSKWEKGITNPDISLLTPLARLLKIDLNTLFCFQKNLSQQEITYFCKEVTSLVQTNGFASGFESAKQKIQEYPHDETLLHCLSFQLDGLLHMSGLSDDEMRLYDDILSKWYTRLTESKDSKIRNSAYYMRAARLIQNGDYKQAQQILDIMPDKEDSLSTLADKKMLQINLYLCQDKTEEAIKDLQNALFLDLIKIQMLLYKIIDANLAAGRMQAAKSIAEKTDQLAILFDLWEYNSYVASLQIATAEKNSRECIRLIQKMLASMCTPWDLSSSPLFCHISKTINPKQMLPAILSEMERDDTAYAFLQNEDEFQKLLAKYKAVLKT